MAEISFGEYFDAQRDRLRKLLSNKNAQLNNEWRERYEEREKQEKEDNDDDEGAGRVGIPDKP